MDQAPNDNETTDAGNGPRPLFGPDRRTPRMRLDLTVNIPTIISILVLIISTSATGVGLYYSLDKRQTETSYAVANLTSRVEKVEASVSAIKVDQAASNDRLRADVKADLSEIKGQLNQLIFTPQQQRNLREWSR